MFTTSQKRTRFTKAELERRIEEINKDFEEAGALVRFITGHRNGYNTVDEYSVRKDGSRVGSGVNRMVGSGTPREAYNESYDVYCGIVRELF